MFFLGIIDGTICGVAKTAEQATYAAYSNWANRQTLIISGPYPEIAAARPPCYTVRVSLDMFPGNVNPFVPVVAALQAAIPGVGGQVNGAPEKIAVESTYDQIEGGTDDTDVNRAAQNEAKNGHEYGSHGQGEEGSESGWTGESAADHVG